jgi:hypothetical protein
MQGVFRQPQLLQAIQQITAYLHRIKSAYIFHAEKCYKLAELISIGSDGIQTICL